MLSTAIRFILYDKPKSIGATVGILFSVFLVGQQAGVFLFLTNSIRNLVDSNKQYIWVVDQSTNDANRVVPLDVRIGRQVASLPGVLRVHEVVVGAGSVRLPDGKTSPLSLVGVQTPNFAGLWNMADGTNYQDLLAEGGIFLDVFSQTLKVLKKGEYFELNGKKVFKAGETRATQGLGVDFGFTTIERARFLTGFDPNKVSFFLVEHDPRLAKSEVIHGINSTVPNVKAWDGEALSQVTFQTALQDGGFASTFGFLIAFAIIAGFVIIGLTLYSAATDRIRDYGTLKALGATNGYVRRLIITQALIFSSIGYAVGRVMVEGFRILLESVGSVFSFGMAMEVVLLLITLFIAIGGSLFAIRRINALEPVAVFRQ